MHCRCGLSSSPWLVLACVLAFAPLAQAQGGATCNVTSIGRPPLTDLASGTYLGFTGGLYPDGANVRPPGHEAAGLAAASQIQPLNGAGQADAAGGHIGFVSIGMSNTNQEFEVFQYAANADPRRNPRVTFVNGAQDGMSAYQWADPTNMAWTTLASAVAAKGLTNSQVQVAWIKMSVRSADVGPAGWESLDPFPATAALMQSKMKLVVQNLKARYPNVRIAYLSSRIYAGYAGLSQYREPYGYEEGFGVKWLIEDQINGDPSLAFSGAGAVAPFLSWGPYLWADGLGADGVAGGVPGRLDGLEYTCADYDADGLHPSPAGREKVSDQLLAFVNADSTSAYWYVNPNPPPVGGTPFYLDLDGVDDYLTVPDRDSLSFVNGAVDSPLTFELWFRPDVMSSKQNLISKWLDGMNQEYKLHISGGAIRLELRDPSAGATVAATTGNQTALAGTWHHLAVTYDGRGGPTAANGITFYVDGVAVPVTRSNAPAYVAMENWTMPLQIGRESTLYKQFNGALDEVRLWNVVRTQGQIQAHMTAELTGPEPGLLAYWRFNEGIGALVADDAGRGHGATAFNNPVWVEGGPMQPPAPDLTPPDITGVTASNLTVTSVTISFTTSEAATGWVSYTPSAACPCLDVYSGATGTTHVVTLTGLQPDTVYAYEPKAMDAAGNFTVVETLTFRTLPIPPDLTPPAVSITQPPPGVVAGTLLVTATAADDTGVTGVQFKVDGAFLGGMLTAPPFAVSWDTATVADGSHTITAEARDAAGNIGSALIAVTVVNTPPETLPYYLDLDGVNDYLSAPDADALSFGNALSDTPLTIEMWIRPDTTSVKQNLASKWLDGVNMEYRLYIASNSVRLDLRDTSAQATVSAYTTNSQAALVGAWHHLAVTYDGRGGATAAAGITIYVDGLAVPLTRINSAAYVAMENGPASLQIGRESTNFKQFNGALDELRLWNVARTQGQIQAQMAWELGAGSAGLVGYWTFNEGTGVTTADGSGRGNTATVFNGALWVPGGPVGPPLP